MTVEEIIDEATRKHRFGARPNLPPGTASMTDPRIVRKIAKAVAKARKRGLLIEEPDTPGSD